MQVLVCDLGFSAAKWIYGAYSGRNRTPFRRETGHDSGPNPDTVPLGKRPPFRCDAGHDSGAIRPVLK